MKNKSNQKGFSLIELLVVVIIIGIIAAIAIPSLLASRRAANEASAVSMLRSIATANATYQSTDGNGSFAASLGALTGQLDPVVIASANSTTPKSGYNTTYVGGTDIFSATAMPKDTASKTYFVDQTNVLRLNNATGTPLGQGTTPAASPSTSP